MKFHHSGSGESLCPEKRMDFVEEQREEGRKKGRQMLREE
jgi:hypothetical protein